MKWGNRSRKGHFSYDLHWINSIISQKKPGQAWLKIAKIRNKLSCPTNAPRHTPFLKKKAQNSWFLKLSELLIYCGRWDLNPHKRNAYKILSLARLPVPTLPHGIKINAPNYNSTIILSCQQIVWNFLKIFAALCPLVLTSYILWNNCN